MSYSLEEHMETNINLSYRRFPTLNDLLSEMKYVSIKGAYTETFAPLKQRIESLILPVQKVRFSIRVSNVHSAAILNSLKHSDTSTIIAVFVVGKDKADYLKSLKAARKITDPRVVFFFSLKKGYISIDYIETYLRHWVATFGYLKDPIPYLNDKFKYVVDDYLSSTFTVLHAGKPFSSKDIPNSLRIVTDRVFPMNFDYLLSDKFINRPLIPDDVFSIFSTPQSELKSTYSSLPKKYRNILDELDILQNVSWYVHRPHSNMSTLRKYIHSYIKEHNPSTNIYNLVRDLYTHPQFSLLPIGSSMVLLALCLSDFIHSSSYKQFTCLVEASIFSESLSHYIKKVFDSFIDASYNTRHLNGVHSYHIIRREKNSNLIPILSKIFSIDPIPDTLVNLQVSLSNKMSSMKMHSAFFGEYTTLPKLKTFFRLFSDFLNISIQDHILLDEKAQELLQILQGDSNIKKQIKQLLLQADKIKAEHPIPDTIPEAFYWLYEYGYGMKIYYGVKTELTMTFEEYNAFNFTLKEKRMKTEYLEWLQKDTIEPFNIPV